MAEQQKSSVFRQKSLETISSPEQLTDYLRVTNPSMGDSCCCYSSFMWIICMEYSRKTGNYCKWYCCCGERNSTDYDAWYKQKEYIEESLEFSSFLLFNDSLDPFETEKYSDNDTFLVSKLNIAELTLFNTIKNYFH